MIQQIMILIPDPAGSQSHR